MYGQMNDFNQINDYRRKTLLAQRANIDYQLKQLEMPQAFPQYQYPANMAQPQTEQKPRQPQLFIKIVGSIDEAKAHGTDPGIWYFFIDVGSGKIYHKRLNENLQTETFVYSIQENNEEKANDDSLAERISRLEKIIGELGNGDNQSVSDVKDVK